MLVAAAPAALSYVSAGIALAAFSIVVWRYISERPNLELRQANITAPDGRPYRVADYHDGIVVGVGDDRKQYVRARIHNSSRSGTARDTQVLAYTPKKEKYVGLDVRPLRWGSAETGDERVTELNIPPGAERHIDLVVSERDGPGRSARLRVGREPTGDGHHLPRGSTTLYLIVACDGRRAKNYEIDLEFDGDNVKVSRDPQLRTRHVT